MAEGKKSFVLYADLIKSIEHLTNEEKGILFNHLLEYVNDLNPILVDRLILTAWKPVELQLKRDLNKWTVKLDKKSEAGTIGNLKRWHPEVYKQFVSGEITLEESQNIAEHRKVSQPDKVQSQPIAKIAVNDNVTVNVNDNVINKKDDSKESLDFDFILETINETFSREFKTINKANKAKYNARLKEGYNQEDIIKAIKNCHKDKFHIESGFKYATVEYFSRSGTLDRFNQEIEQPKKGGYENSNDPNYFKHQDDMVERLNKQREQYGHLIKNDK